MLNMHHLLMSCRGWKLLGNIESFQCSLFDEIIEFSSCNKICWNLLACTIAALLCKLVFYAYKFSYKLPVMSWKLKTGATWILPEGLKTAETRCFHYMWNGYGQWSNLCHSAMRSGTRMWRSLSDQMVSCCVYEMPKQLVGLMWAIISF